MKQNPNPPKIVFAVATGSQQMQIPVPPGVSFGPPAIPLPPLVSAVANHPRDEKGRFLQGPNNAPHKRREYSRESLSAGEFKRLCRRLMPAAIDKVEGILDNPDAHPATIMQAITWLSERSYGKAVQPIEVGGPGTFDNMTDDELNEFIKAEAAAIVSGDIDE